MPIRPRRGRGRRVKPKFTIPDYRTGAPSRRAGRTTKLEPKRPRPSPAEWQPGIIVAEVGDTLGSLAQKAGVEEIDFIQANQDVTTIKADAVYNVPNIPTLETGIDLRKMSIPKTIPSPPPAFLDPVFETAPPADAVPGFDPIRYPDAFNPQLFREYGQTIGTEEFAYEDIGVGKYYQQGYFEGVEGVEDLYGAVAEFRTDISKRQYDLEELYGQTISEREAIQKSLDLGKYYQEGMFEIPGVPLKYRWEQDEQGNWIDRGPEAVFDALYEMNGIDPNDDAMVEWFWGFADDDLLFMGEFFDVIEWPVSAGTGIRAGARARTSGGGGGGGGGRGDYASYLSYTSWSI